MLLTDATIYVGGLDEKVNESLVWELFVQAGPVVNVHMPKDRVTLMHQVSSLTHFKYYFRGFFIKITPQTLFYLYAIYIR